MSSTPPTPRLPPTPSLPPSTLPQGTVILSADPEYGVRPATTDGIAVFIQFFVSKNPNRQRELLFCVQKNLENPLISRVVMLNERIYSDKELGSPVNSEKIQQIVIGRRMRYGDVVRYVNAAENGIRGYVVIANTDIFFDKTIKFVKHSNIDSKRKMFAMLRVEYSPDEMATLPMLYDSQDVWIFHTNQFVSDTEADALDFELGVPGCDNRMAYIMRHELGYEVVNDPLRVRCYHYHTSQYRTYSNDDRIRGNYSMIVPVLRRQKN